MEFIEHTIAWCKGEVFEGRIILFTGILIIVSAFLFYKMGTTPYAKAIVLPLLVLGVFYSATGLAMNFSNEKRIEQFSKEYEVNKKEFIKEEKQRVENFSNWYIYTRISMSIIIAAGIVMYFIGGTTLTSIALVLMILGFSGFALDHFSQERAKTYYEQILKTKV